MIEIGRDKMRLSVLTIAIAHGGTVSRECGICRRECRVPIQDLVLVQPPGDPIEWDVDVGGYCAGCGDFRCEQHVAARDDVDRQPDAPGFSILHLFCRQCGARVGAPPRVPVDDVPPRSLQ